MVRKFKVPDEPEAAVRTETGKIDKLLDELLAPIWPQRTNQKATHTPTSSHVTRRATR